MSPRTYRPGDPEYFHATPPDSDAREVAVCTYDGVCGLCGIDHFPAEVTIRKDLAQRILAALEGEAAFLHNEGKESGSRMLYDVASELRAVIGK